MIYVKIYSSYDEEWVASYIAENDAHIDMFWHNFLMLAPPGTYRLYRKISFNSGFGKEEAWYEFVKEAVKD